MKDLPEELIYLLLFGAILLFNYITQQIARRRQAEEARQPQHYEPLQEQSAEAEPMPDFWGRTPPPAETQQAPPLPVVPAPRTRRTGRFSKQALFGNKGAVQDAIVIATILGPCRGLEPPGSAPGDSVSGIPIARAGL